VRTVQIEDPLDDERAGEVIERKGDVVGVTWPANKPSAELTWRSSRAKFSREAWISYGSSTCARSIRIYP